ncbi:MAG TPA: hypothetical protein ENN45_01695 [Bacteroidetes bacterium]|nr:hypothetical protein [Bacteroidota bacterium]
MKKILVGCLMIILLAVLLSGCNSNDNKSSNNTTSKTSKFIGTWVGGAYDGESFRDDETWTFYTNGSLKKVTTFDWDPEGNDTITEWYTFEIDEDGELCTGLEEASFFMCYEYEFSNSDATFRLLLGEEFLSYEFNKV